MTERYCLIFDSLSESSAKLAESVKAWNVCSDLETSHDVQMMRSTLKRRLINSKSDDVSFLIIGATIQQHEITSLLKSFSQAMSDKLKVLLLKTSESAEIKPEIQSQVEVIQINDPNFLSLRVRLSEIAFELDSAQKKQVVEDIADASGKESSQSGAIENPFASANFALHVMKTVQRLEILLWSQGGTKLEDKILPRFIVGKLARELLEFAAQSDLTNDFRKHFELSVVEWNRSLKKNSLEQARTQLIKQILSFHAFANEIRIRFDHSPNVVEETPALEPSGDSATGAESSDSLASAIGKGFSELDNFWGELWKDVDITDVTPAAEALLEKRVRQFVLNLLGNFVENEIIREFRMYFEKHMMQWYKDARTMPQEQASAILRKRILSFPGLPRNLAEQDGDDATEAASVAEVMTHIVASFGELVPLFEQGNFALDEAGDPTPATQKAIKTFVDGVFASAPKTVRLEEFRSYFGSAIQNWATTAKKSGFADANATLRTQLQGFYKKL